MSYDIIISKTKIITEYGTSIAKIDTVINKYCLSYKWTELSSICSAHIYSIKCNCSRDNTYIWFLGNDLHRRFGSDVANRAEKAIGILSQLGINILTPDPINKDWLNGKNMSRADRLGAFAYHLNKICQLGKKYPDASFIVDDNNDNNDDKYLISSDDKTIPIISDSDHYTRSNIATTCNHPIKGDIQINNFNTAIEVFGYFGNSL